MMFSFCAGRYEDKHPDAIVCVREKGRSQACDVGISVASHKI